MAVHLPEHSQKTQDYIDRYGRDGKLYCRQHKGKVRATWLLHYSQAGVIVHEPMCDQHANAVPTPLGYEPL
jgi:hypothetical protein